MARRRKQTKEEQPADLGVVLFTALSMILLAFFIMLNNLATPDSLRTHAALSSLLGTFGMMPGHEVGIEGLSPSPPRNGEVGSEVATNLELVVDSRPLHGVSVTQNASGNIVLRMDTEVLFPTGQIHISPAVFSYLDAARDLILRYQVPVRIEGHSDGRPTAGRRSNWYLSAARAASVHRYLEQTGEVLPGLVRSVGYGSTRPPDDGTAPRRVEIIFLTNDHTDMP